MRKLIFLFFIFIAFQACSDNGAEIDAQNQSQAEPEKPRFVMSLTDGGTIAVVQDDDGLWGFDGLNGRLKLLFFFDIACEPCRAMLPHLVDIETQYSNHLEVFGILTQSTNPDALNALLQSYNINFKIAHFSEEIADIFPNNADIPYTILYDLSGRKVLEYNGVLPQEMLEFDIRKTLEQNGEEGEAQEESQGEAQEESEEKGETGETE